MKFADIDSFIDEIDSQVPFDVLALQEITNCFESFGSNCRYEHPCGHLLLFFNMGAGCNSVGFLIHRRNSQDIIRLHGVAGRGAGLTMRFMGLRIRFLCAHMPTGASRDTYWDNLMELERLVGKRDDILLMGCDANVTLPCMGEDDCTVGKDVDTRIDCMGSLFRSWLVARGLVAASTFSNASGNVLTRHPSEHETTIGVQGRQLDYVVSDALTRVRLVSTLVHSLVGAYVGSDHDLVLTHWDFSDKFDLSSIQGAAVRRKRKLKGWRPQNLDQLHLDVLDKLNEGSCMESIKHFTEMVSEVCSQHGCQNVSAGNGEPGHFGSQNEAFPASIGTPQGSPGGSWGGPRAISGPTNGGPRGNISQSSQTKTVRRKELRSEEEKELLRMRKDAAERHTKANLTKQLWRLRRREKRIRENEEAAALLNRVGENGAPRPIYNFSKKRLKMRQSCPVTLEATINQTKMEATGESDMEQLMTTYFKELYRDENFDVPRWLLDSSSLPEGDVYSLAQQIFSLDRMKVAISSMKPESSGSDDGVVVSMVRALPDEAIGILEELFCQRFVRFNTEKGSNKLDADDEWRQLHTVLIPKVVSPGSLEQFRPITVMSVIAKLYYKCMAMQVTDLTQGKLHEHIFSYRKGYSASEEVFAVRQLIEKSNEWDIPMCVCRADIRKAYDQITTKAIIQALTYFQLPKEMVRAIVVEWMSFKTVFCLSSLNSEPICKSMGMPQGDPLSPIIFNLCVHHILSGLTEKWAGDVALGMPIQCLDGTHQLVQAMAFADDFAIFARLPHHLQRMLTDLQEALGRAGMQIDTKPDKTVWMHNLAVQFVKEDKQHEDEKSKKNHLKKLKREAGKQLTRLKKETQIYKELSEAYKDGQMGVGPTVSRSHPGLSERQLIKLAEVHAETNFWKSRRAATLPPKDETYVAPFSMSINGRPVHYSPPWQGFNLLGSIITGDGRTEKDLDSRLTKAWTAFYGLKKIFLNELVDPKLRMRALDVFIRPILTYGAESWIPSKNDLEKIRVCQLSMGRMICSFKVRPDEEHYQAIMRSTSRVDRIMETARLQPWHHFVLGKIHKWAGHIARYQTYAPQRLALETLWWRNGLHIDTTRAQSTDGRHLHRGHRRGVWRWEGELHKAYETRGIWWPLLAQDRAKWLQNENWWTQTRLDKRGWL